MFCARVSRVLLGSQASKLVSACLLGFPQGLFSLRSVPYPVYSYSCITRTDVKQGEAIKSGFLERPSHFAAEARALLPVTPDDLGALSTPDALHYAPGSRQGPPPHFVTPPLCSAALLTLPPSRVDISRGSLPRCRGRIARQQLGAARIRSHEPIASQA